MKNKIDGLRKNNVPESGYLLKMELTPFTHIDHTLKTVLKSLLPRIIVNLAVALRIRRLLEHKQIKSG
jgi:hypothetical protein